MTSLSEKTENRIWSREKSLWTSGAALHLPLDGAARCWICRAPGQSALVVLPDGKQARTFLADWRTLFPEENAFLLPEIPLTAEGVSGRALPLQRGEILSRWKEGGGIALATPGALMAPFRRGEGDLLIRPGEIYSRERLLDWLVHGGYVRSDLVWSPGQFVFRGYILDLFDPAYAHPLRIEFFDESVESLRSFSPSTQKSVGILDSVEIHSLNSSKNAALGDFLSEETRIVLFEPSRIETSAESYQFLWNEIASAEGGLPLPPWSGLFLSLASRDTLRVTASLQYTRGGFTLEEVPLFRGNLEKFLWTGETWRNDGYSVRLVTQNPRILSFGAREWITPVEGTLSRGFLDPEERIVYVSDLELAGISEKIGPSGLPAPPAEWGSRLSDGQLLVHEDYGLCVFRGSEEISVSGEVMDSLILEFANNQRLFLPVLQLYKVTPLPDFADEDVRLDSLKGSKWKKSVAKTKERVREELAALLELYARREIVPGYPFPPADDLTREFEEAFPYPETRDQLKAVSEVMADMEKPLPMDRLLVGDVGYGKTEVAVRAAFRAAQGGKQTAVLVPTTILAQQHYLSFTARMTGFPVRVALLSRFLPLREQREVLRQVAEGRVDILIGTARMLQKDVVFSDLGLLVVDEEHRFGVLSKEKLKAGREALDVLMLSATPIPRSLSLSLKGLRNISVLNDPPRNRVPVVTTAAPWNASMIKKAVHRELERGGQVFYVTNRIEGIEDRAAFLRKLFPSATLGVVHGRVRERELEETMMKFYNNEIQILLCTTIIESGLDVPGANTLIVEDSRQLGLAQMYQLRGRIGRREEAAYAWFLYPEGQPLSRETLERLDAITSVGDRGAGYDLAMEDLRIRGSGDLLGTAQHGEERRGAESFLYYRLLEEEIGRLRGTLPASASVSVDFPCLVPSSYIPQESIRIALYRRLLRLEGWEELRDIEREVLDRFGPLPQSLQNLFSVSLLRSRGGKYGIVSVESTRRDTVLQGSGPLFDALGKKKNWYGRAKGLIGPGGSSGLADILSAVRHLKQGAER